MMPDSDMQPKALKNIAAVARRRQLLATRPSHMEALIEYVAMLRRKYPKAYVPDFDPLGGGTETRALFLLEKPGPLTAPPKGSGFLSIHNNDESAAATHRFLLGCNRVPLSWRCFANVIPGWNGTRKITPEEYRSAGADTHLLLALLPRLRAIVLVGGTAQRAWINANPLVRTGIRIYRSAHPGPLVRAANPEMWRAIPSQWPRYENLRE